MGPVTFKTGDIGVRDLLRLRGQWYRLPLRLPTKTNPKRYEVGVLLSMTKKRSGKISRSSTKMDQRFPVPLYSSSTLQTRGVKNKVYSIIKN